MESSQAVNCVKAFQYFHRAVTFERPNESSGYTIRFEGLKYESDKELVRKIAKKLCLTVKEEADSIAIL
jgi:hypothetical protein